MSTPLTIPMMGDPRDRVDGRVKVTGGAKYAAEYNLPGIVHAVVVPSTIPSGAITAIDATEAKKAQGVLAVISHLNAPKISAPSGNFSEPHLIPFSDNSVHYVGQQIAVVVADTIEHATHAAELVKVKYEERTARTDMAALRGEAKDKASQQSPPFTKGDADGAFASAPVKVDQTYRTPYEHHNAMEAHSIVVAWDGDHVTLHDSSQNIFAVRQTIAHAFGIPPGNVHVVSPFVGGAFGSKGSSWPHVLVAAMAAHEVKLPVKLWITRKQLFFTNGHRPETEQRVALGATQDGKLVSVIHEGISQGNAVCEYNERFTRPTRVLYAAPNMRMSNLVVELNVSSPTYMRAPGESPGTFALESAMDELAVTLKMDPLQLRLVNYADTDPSDGKPWSSKSLKECYSRAAERFGWLSGRNPEPRATRAGRWLIGQGMASATYPAHRSPSVGSRPDERRRNRRHRLRIA